jgi:hypothetical protein
MLAGGAAVANVHASGEIWGQTLWDLRRAVGSPASQALITQAMRISPRAPTFIDQRNAILAADTALSGGANRDVIWRVFAARGMGFGASTRGGGDRAPVADFTTPAPVTPPQRPAPAQRQALPALPAPGTPVAVTRAAGRPRVALDARGSGGRATFRVTCPAACTVTATLTADRRVARRLRLAPGTPLGSIQTGAVGGRPRLSVAMSGRVITAMRRAGVRAIAVTLSVRVVSADGRAATGSRRVTLRR